jgi:hypothetical protein
MKVLKQTAAVLVILVVIALVLAALMPNRVRALVAALVQVTNTTANPVPNQDVDNPARSVFRLRV